MNNFGRKVPLEVIYSNLPAISRDIWWGFLEPCPAWPWNLPGMGHPPPLWANGLCILLTLQHIHPTKIYVLNSFPFCVNEIRFCTQGNRSLLILTLSLSGLFPYPSRYRGGVWWLGTLYALYNGSIYSVSISFPAKRKMMTFYSPLHKRKPTCYVYVSIMVT